MKEFAETTPITIVIEEDFLIKVNDESWVSILSDVDDTPYTEVTSVALTHKPIYDFCASLGLS